MALNKKNNIRGYRLHKQRVLFSGGEIIRTIKYPIYPLSNNPQQQILFENFKKLVIQDDLKIRGDLNLNDYINYTYKNNHFYTLFSFYFDSLKAGVVWAPTSSALIDFINVLYPSIASPINKIWDNADPKIRDFFDKESFIKNVIIISQIRTSNNKNSFKQKLISYLQDDFKEKEDKGNRFKIKSKEAEELINYIVEAFFNENGKLALDGQKQNEFWQKNFNLDKSLLEKAKPKGELKDITFIIIPELISVNEDNLTIEKLIFRRQLWLKRKIEELKQEVKKKEIENWLKKILGLENNFNGFSNYFGSLLKSLQKNESDKIFEALKTFLPDLEKNEYKIKIFQALSFLSDKAKKLEKPSLPSISSWADYRSVFGGKLQSWFSNFIRREDELHKQLENFKKGLESAKKLIIEKGDKLVQNENANQEIDNINLLIYRLEKIVQENKVTKESEYEVFNSLLSSLKKRLNFFYQTYLQEENDNEKKVIDVKEFKEIYKKIYKPIAFFGYSSVKRNKKIIEKTIPIIEDGIELILNLLSNLNSDFDPLSTFNQYKRKNDTEENNYRKLLQFLLDKYQNSALNSPLFKKKFIYILQKEFINPSWSDFTQKKDPGRYVLYKSPYSKGSLIQIEINKDNWLVKYQQFILELKNFLQQFDKEKLLNDENLLLDWVELSKNIFAHLLRFNKKKEFSIENLNFQNFDTAKNYISLFSLKNISKNEFAFIIQSLIFSELKGAAILFSKKNYIAKYILQVIKSNSKFLLFYQPKNAQLDLKTINLKANNKSLMLPHQYFISLSKVKINKNKDPNFINIDKKSTKKVFLENNQLDGLFRLSSSPYQLQFLDKFLYKPKSWENIEITLSEWSFIVENEYQIKWDLQNKKPQFILKPDSKKNKLYLVIPFHINTKVKSSQLKNIDEKRVNYPILGIDVGEYGLGYCLLSIQNNQIDIKKTGFIIDENIANIKDKFAQIQQKARRGVFNESNNSVSRVRENAIGHLRNQLHVVLIDNDGASAIYEYQISNFETGSNKTIKIYDSVKRADVKIDTDADKQIHNHIWGNNTKLIGRHLSAYASSYTCAKCHRSLYQFKKQDIEGALIVKKEGNILEIKLKDGTILNGFSQDKKYENQSEIYLEKSDKDLKLFKKLISDFARPPLSKNSEVINKFASQLLKDDFINKFRKKRGNSAIFICPFSNCHFITDADIQAAFIMAIRGYLNFSGIVKSKKSENENEVISSPSYFEETIKFLKQSNFNSFNSFLPKLIFIR